ncbi:MAG: hypothetical protein Q8808_02280 [Candidatus Phytoplasma australasiaticum]|nr:hypothetical protein [Candidatus Phytoplasma australasiaticum]
MVMVKTIARGKQSKRAQRRDTGDGDSIVCVSVCFVCEIKKKKFLD